MKIGIVNDHRGYLLKTELVKYLIQKKYEVINYGTDSEESVDYPEYGFLIGNKVVSGEVDYGIAICGSGIGISIACNKVDGVRCAKVNNSEEAYYTRIDNDANIIALSGKMLVSDAKKIIDVFLSTEFSKVERHVRRIAMISKYEESRYNER